MKEEIVPNQLIEDFINTWNEMTPEEYKQLSGAHRINSGWCYQMAILLRKIHGRKAKIWMNSSISMSC